jgi:hypothetical protein
VALQLKRQGIARVRPLLGGLRLWTERGFPTMPLALPSKEAAPR